MKLVNSLRQKFDRKIIPPLEKLLALAWMHSIHVHGSSEMNTYNLVIISQKNPKEKRVITSNVLSSLIDLEIFKTIASPASSIDLNLDKNVYGNFMQTFEEELPALLRNFAELAPKLTEKDDLETVLNVLITENKTASPPLASVSNTNDSSQTEKIEYSLEPITHTQPNVSKPSIKQPKGRHNTHILAILREGAMKKNELIDQVLQIHLQESPDAPIGKYKASCRKIISKYIDEGLITESKDGTCCLNSNSDDVQSRLYTVPPKRKIARSSETVEINAKGLKKSKGAISFWATHQLKASNIPTNQNAESTSVTERMNINKFLN